MALKDSLVEICSPLTCPSLVFGSNYEGGTETSPHSLSWSCNSVSSPDIFCSDKHKVGAISRPCMGTMLLYSPLTLLVYFDKQKVSDTQMVSSLNILKCNHNGQHQNPVQSHGKKFNHYFKLKVLKVFMLNHCSLKTTCCEIDDLKLWCQSFK